MKLAIFVTVQLILIEVFCQNLQCVNHPALDGLQRIVLQQKKYDQLLYEKLSQILTKFEDKIAANSNVNLGICSQYAGQATCCDADLVSLLKDLAFSKFKEIKLSKTFFSQVLSNIGLSINKCGAKSEGQVNDVESIDTGIKEVEIFKTKYKQCQIKIIKTTIRYYRGQVCSICAGLDNISKYFTGSSQPVLEESTFNTYFNDLIESSTCMDDLRKELPEIVNLLFDELSDQSSECNQIKAIYQKMLTDNLNYPCQGLKCDESCSQLYFLDTQYNCEANSFVPNDIQEQISQIQQKGYFTRQSTTQSSSRLLSNTKKSNFFLTTSGIKPYLFETAQDGEVTLEGAVYIFSKILNFSITLFVLLLIII